MSDNEIKEEEVKEHEVKEVKEHEVKEVKEHEVKEVKEHEVKEVKEQEVKEKKVQTIIGELSREDLNLFNIRRDIINNKKIELKLLEGECDSFLAVIREKYKLVMGKEYIIDNDGKIIEIINKVEE